MPPPHPLLQWLGRGFSRLHGERRPRSWERRSPRGVVNDARPYITLGLRTQVSPEIWLPCLWDIVRDAEIRFTPESFEIDDGFRRAFDAHQVTEFCRKRYELYRYVRVYGPARRDAARVDISPKFWDDRTDVTITTYWAGDDLDSYLEWLTRLLDELPIEGGETGYAIRRGPYRPHIDLLDDIFRSPWMAVLGEAHEPYLPAADLVSAASTLPWVRLVRARRNTVLLLGLSPLAVPDERQCAELEAALLAIHDASFVRSHGYHPRELVPEILTPALASCGFEPTATPKKPLGFGDWWFIARPASGARAVSIKFDRRPDPMLTVWLHHVSGEPDADLDDMGWYRSRFPINEGELLAYGRRGAQLALEGFAAQARTVMLPWFDSPASRWRERPRRLRSVARAVRSRIRRWT